MTALDEQQLAPPARGTPAARPQTTIIAPSRGWGGLRLRELWAYRELLYFFVWRDVKVRYKQTVLGVAWAIVPPVMTMLVFTLFFGTLAKIPSDGVPYPVFNFTGLLPWQLFALALSGSANSMVTNANLIRKVYFPRLVVPLANVLAGLVDFGIAFVVLMGLMAYFRIAPTAAVLLLPVFTLLALVSALGVGLWLSALNVKYRDVRHIVPFLTQFWMFATPIVYPSALLPEPWRTLYGLNPMAGVVEGFRWALLGTNPPGPMIAVSAAVSVILLATGLLYFQRTERTFADVV